MVVEKDGLIVVDVGSTFSPLKEVAASGTRIVEERTFSLAANDGTLSVDELLWDYAQEPSDGRQWLGFLIETDGAIEIAWKGDKPTSSSDDTPLGTHITWAKKRLSCWGSELFQTQTMSVTDTATEYVGSDFHADLVEGLIYTIRARNLSEEDACTVRITKFY
jgi:hypothetical protein